jgi:GTP cyclohydrolase I
MEQTLPDIQKTVDTREVRINRVGVARVKIPIKIPRQPDPSIMMFAGERPCETVGEFELGVSLDADKKGTHMSRFTEIVNAHTNRVGLFSVRDLKTIAAEMLEKLASSEVTVKLELDYFIQQESPATNRPGIAPIKAFLEVHADALGGGLVGYTTYCGIDILGKTVCPCSREISEFDPETGKGKGAHAQRGLIQVRVRHDADHVVWFEELAHCAWRAFSAPVYPVLKRPDERHVTMAAYSNPKFVEDVIRDMALQMRAHPKVQGFKIRVQNAESIHYHDAYAEVEENY